MAPGHNYHAKCFKKKEDEEQVKKAVPKKPRAPKATDGKEVLRLIGHDHIRELVVPSDIPTSYPVMMNSEEYHRLHDQSCVDKKPKTKLQIAREQEVIQEKQIKECNERKDKIREWDMKKKQMGTRLTEIESDARDRANHLLRRAFELRQEQEDEVKLANRLIMGVKCHAIRDAQVREKELLRREMEAEERRLDNMMEEERKRAIQLDEQRKEKERVESQKQIRILREQIEENEVERVLEAERIEEESRMLGELNTKILLEAIEEEKNKLEQQARTRAELAATNEQLLAFQRIEQEESRIADLKVQEFQRKRAEREAAYEEEQRQLALAKEREVARLRALQQRQQDLQAEMDELNARRTQDEVERQWRQKEKEAALKQKEAADALAKARADQVLDRRRNQAMEIAREKREYQRVLAAQIESAEQEKRQDAGRRQKAEDYRTQVLLQINEKEKLRIEERRERFKEGEIIREEERMRLEHTREVMRSKVKELRHYKVPEEYVREIEHQLKLTTEE